MPRRLIYVGNGDHLDYSDPVGRLVRPSEPEEPESGGLPAVNFLDRSGRHTRGRGALLDVDYCMATHAGLADGLTPAPWDLWLDCLAPDWFGATAKIHGDLMMHCWLKSQRGVAGMTYIDLFSRMVSRHLKSW